MTRCEDCGAKGRCGCPSEREARAEAARDEHDAKVEAAVKTGVDDLTVNGKRWMGLYVMSMERHHDLIGRIVHIAAEGGSLLAVLELITEHLDGIDALGVEEEADAELETALVRARDAADEIAGLRAALGEVAQLAWRGQAWSLHTRQQVRDVCNSALAYVDQGGDS